MLAIFVLWLVQLWCYCKAISFCFKTFLKYYWIGLIGALILTCFLFVSLSPDYRVLSDETNLLAVSKSMTYNKTIFNTTMGKWYYDNFHPIQQEIPIRPPMFPFLISLLHSLFGFSRNNIFILNGLGLFALLSLVYVCVKKTLDTTSGFAAMILIASQPIITLSATSAGFDLFSATFLAITLISLYGFMRELTSHGLSLLWINLMMFCYIRYESVVYFLLLLGFLVGFRLLRLHYLKPSLYLYVLTPIIYLPYLWQRILTKGNYEVPEGMSLFSVNSFWSHLSDLLSAQLCFDFYLPFATGVNITGVLLLGILLIGLALKKFRFAKPFQGYYAFTVSLCLLVHTSMYLAHHAGQYTHPTQARFFIVFVICLTLIPFIYKSIGGALPSRLLLVGALIAFILYHPIGVENRFYNTMTLPRKTRYVRDFLNKFEDKAILVIIDRPGQYISENYGAVDFDYANQNLDSLLNDLKRGLFKEIIVVQDLNYDTQSPISSNKLNAKFQLKTLSQRQYTATKYIKISCFKQAFK
ncbi:ArnT family glycosyltransferase [Chroococcidiopsis cubana]|nr:glycosyltransferase family 39 protein [Chroococcidiopsis cubana]